MAEKRVIIVDVMHLFYKYAYGGAASLSYTIDVNGVPTRVDTTLPTYVIKQIFRWADGGVNPTVVCFDGAGSTRSRKAYFMLKGDQESGVGYKEGRTSQDSRFYDGINITMNLMMNGGVTCLKADGYEADDLIKAAVDKAKIKYPGMPIDIITGDQDLIPLVDGDVSVFIQSRKSTWAESKDIEKNHYFQLRPYNYQEYVESLTAYKKLQLPYNTLLLAKLLRGDKSDNIPAYPKFTPTKFNSLIDSLVNDGYELDDMFRYDEPVSRICYRGSEEPIPEDIVGTVPNSEKMIKYSEPKVLTEMCNVLSDYLDDSVIDHIRFVYNGINLNGVFVGLPDKYNRRPAKLSADICGFSAAKLQTEVSKVKINLPMV